MITKFKLFESAETKLDVSKQGLTVLPELSETLKTLWCYSNQLKELPVLPQTLEKLYCTSNQLKELPALPESLKYLWCNSNQLKELPELPKSLTTLYCGYNKLKSLPELPESLTEFGCDSNPFTYPLSRKIIDKFKLDESKLYTDDIVEVFKIYEWQAEFLEDFPWKYEDISYFVLDQIKIDFDYIYDSIDMGIY